MNITKKQDGDLLTIELEGRLDTLTSPDLETVLKESLDDVKSLTFDLAKLVLASESCFLLRKLFITEETLRS